MYCRNCGTKINDIDKFCYVCGYKNINENGADEQIHNAESNINSDVVNVNMSSNDMGNMDKETVKLCCEKSKEEIDKLLTVLPDDTEEIANMKDIVVNKEEYTISKLIEVENKFGELGYIDIAKYINDYITLAQVEDKKENDDLSTGGMIQDMIIKLAVCVIVVLIGYHILSAVYINNKCYDCGRITFEKYSINGRTYSFCRECAVNEFYPFDSSNYKIK